MSSNNNNSDAGAMIGFAVAAMAMMAFFVFAVLAFLAFVMTILAICAWNKPLHIGKKLVIEPDEARAFVGRGLVGMGVVPAFVLFVDVFLGVHINWGYLNHMMVFGYVAGSLGIEMLMADDSANGSAERSQHHEALPAPQTQRALPPAPREPFNFASWDDEEENRR